MRSRCRRSWYGNDTNSLVSACLQCTVAYLLSHTNSHGNPLSSHQTAIRAELDSATLHSQRLEDELHQVTQQRDAATHHAANLEERLREQGVSHDIADSTALAKVVAHSHSDALSPL